MILPGFRKAVVDQTGSRRPNSDYDLFLVQFGFGKCFGASSQSSHWASCCQLSCKIHFLLHITIQSRNGSLLLPRIREDDISKWWCFLFSVSSQGTHFSNLFTYPICFKYWMIIDWLTLSSLATSCVVVIGSALIIALSWSLSTSKDSHYSPHFQGSHLLCKTFWITAAPYIH